MKQYLEIGKIVSTHGVQGEFNVDLWCDNAAFAKQFKVLYLGGSETPLFVRRIRAKGQNQIIVQVDGVDSIDAAKLLVGKLLLFARADAQLPEGVYFHSDLIGLEVRDADSGELYGLICDVFATGANDVYVMKNQNGKEILFPAIREVVVSVDTESGGMKIRPIEGMLDEN